MRKIEIIAKVFITLVLLEISGEVLWRRWIWGQEPTQIPNWFVYLMVLSNGVAVFLVLRSLRSRAPLTKT